MRQGHSFGAAILVAAIASASVAGAQDDPFAGDDVVGGGEAESAAPPAAPEAEAPADEAAPAEEAPAPAAEAGGGVSLGVSAAAGSEDASLAATAATSDADAELPAPAATTPSAKAPVLTGSHIRRPRLIVDGAMIIDSPLTTTIEDRESLRYRRQLGGVAMPDTTAALGLGGSGTSLFTGVELRQQPTLVLLNGRRLVSAPFPGSYGADFVDLNQLPLQLIERVETTRGNTVGLYGDGAVGGTVNYITHRNYDGFEVDVGGQATTEFDQGEADVALTVGAGSEKTGMNAMVGYFNRQPLGASDRDWIAERSGRTASLQNSPASFQPLANFEYPVPDPLCGVATNAGHAAGLELRIPLFGIPVTRSGENAIGLLPTSPFNYQDRYINNFDIARGNSDGMLGVWVDPADGRTKYETSTYCSGDFSSVQDLILEEERIQAYTTFWHALSDHTEGFGELGFYRSEDVNRTAPSFPVTRVAPNPANLESDAVIIRETHPDLPLAEFGFAVADNVPPDARMPNSQFLVGRVSGLWAGHNTNERQVDVVRGVIGLRGDFEEVGAGSAVESWDWELAGLYTTSTAVSRVPDILLDELSEALASCAPTKTDLDAASPTFGEQVPTTIKDRQEAGCYNPFYSSVVNNAGLNPLGVPSPGAELDGGYVVSDSEAGMSAEIPGFGLQDGGYICDPNDPSSPACPSIDIDGDGDVDPWPAGTPNTKQVIDRMTGEHITSEQHTLATADAILRGDVLEFEGGGLSFGLGGQFRRETLRIDYDAAFNQRLYAFVFGAPDVDPVGRNIAAGFGELRVRLADGLVEVQPAARIEHFGDVGTAVSPLGGLALRPFAAMATPPEALEWLVLRGHAGLGHRAPSLLQMHGTYTEFAQVEFTDAIHFVPHQIQGNPDLDFERYTTVSGGLQWDYVGIRIQSDFWMTFVDDVIGADNLQTLLNDCEQMYDAGFGDCPGLGIVDGTRSINHVESGFDNLAEVETNGIDGGASYTLDTKRRGLGDIGTFVAGVQGRFINSYLIKGPRALRRYFRTSGGAPGQMDGTLDYSGIEAEYEAAGYRNLENFAPPLPQLRFSVPIRWLYEGHMLGATMRYTGSYYDDSETTIEKYGLASELSAGLSNGTVGQSDGEQIDAWVVFDALYGFAFGDEGWRTKLTVGVLNLLDEAPPEAEGPLGYDVGIHDPRGRVVYLRATGQF